MKGLATGAPQAQPRLRPEGPAAAAKQNEVKLQGASLYSNAFLKQEQCFEIMI